MQKTSESIEEKLMIPEAVIETNSRSLIVKRMFDIILSLFGILLSLPLWLLIALAIKLNDRGPIFYTHYRVGRRGKIFKAYKFRSMIKDAEREKGAVWAEENDPRVTLIGQILRATAFDEFPQLINIFLGDMSFVGPRPERPELVERFSAEINNYDRRHGVKPGLTGIAQVFGKYDTRPKHKLKYDLLYIQNQNFWLDLKLIMLSFWITARGKWQSREKKKYTLLRGSR
ncbi:MAG: sugar transferase [Candidatus Aminicenantes bacterium]|nr:sugar transferase [Candidatus Aminicenantes bacterium]